MGAKEGMITADQRDKAKNLALCGLFAALTAAGAFIKITIPLQPYPMHITMQWFFVLRAGLLLEPRLASMSICTYLAVGLLGIPVFAAGGGPAYLIRPTFGFLLGFAMAAWVMAWLCQLLRPAGIRGMMLPAVCGLAVYYLSGMVYFYLISNYVILMPVGWKVILVNCCLATIIPDFLLCILAAGMAVRLGPVLRGMGAR